ncbi:rRNA methyltransferase 3, mitochondrial [Lycorma delicatula]|uniref:rRNA methyltransferase 3, mitochondrial n=1 Tax=Lycorma delicatula TaxID=130591 RepID=UPI003F51897A
MNFLRSFNAVCMPFAKETKKCISISIFNQTACYSIKIQHRRPIKVYDANAESEIQNMEEDGTSKKPIKRFKDEILGVVELNKEKLWNRNKSKIESEMNVEGLRTDETDSDDEKGETILGSTFVRLGDSDTRFERMIFKVQSKKQRHKANIIMLEGKRLIQDAISAGVVPTEIYFSRKSMIENLVMPAGLIKLYKMPYNKMKKWSQLDTPPGVVAFCQMPKTMVAKQNFQLPLTVICDNVREPGNLGTILRTVAGVGCNSVILTKGCTDMWDPKVLRSAAGAHFHIPVESGLTWDEICKKLDKNTRIFIAEHKEEAEMSSETMIPIVPYFSVKYSNLQDICIIIGGETEGISDEAVNLARYLDGLKINIPLNNNIDSLNVGAAISTILFEIKRQFIINNDLNCNEGNDVKSVK